MSLARQVRSAYIALARFLRLLFLWGAVHYLVRGDYAAVAVFALMFLLCDTQVRVTKLEQEVDGEL